MFLTFQALDYPYNLEEVTKTVPTKLRAETAPIPQYLFSRSVAGTSHQDLIDSMTLLTKGQIKARFFRFYPERQVSLSHWLAHWLNKGAIPVATLNRQLALLPGQNIPDAWHHQMIFGVSPNGVFLTNPLENVREHTISQQLCSNSELLVRRSDIVSRWHPTCDLQILAEIETDERWDQLNVLGQVISVLREEHLRPASIGAGSAAAASSPVGSGQPTAAVSPSTGPGGTASSNPVQRTHVRIPAMYESGITLFVDASISETSADELMSAPELPLKNPQNSF